MLRCCIIIVDDERVWALKEGGGEGWDWKWGENSLLLCKAFDIILHSMTKCFYLRWIEFVTRKVHFAFIPWKLLLIDILSRASVREKNAKNEWEERRREFLMDTKMKNYLLLESMKQFTSCASFFSHSSSLPEGEKLYCCVYFWLKRWNKEKYTTIECLSALTRNCGRRDVGRYFMKY